jgi:hypothetical protein
MPKQFRYLAVHQSDASLGIDDKDSVRICLDEYFSLAGQGFCRRNSDAQPMDEGNSDTAADYKRRK